VYVAYEKAVALLNKHEHTITHVTFWAHSRRTFEKALAYVFERQNLLRVFLSNPDMPFDTSHLERALRVIAMGRKNHLVCWCELGAEPLGILQSLMVTCRIQGINPYTYLVDVPQRVGIHLAKDVFDLVPRV